MQSILQVLKINDVREGTSKKTGNAYKLQTAECVILKDDGSVDQVGVLPIPRELIGQLATGTYLGTFALRPNYQTRVIEAVLTGVQQYAVKGSLKADAKGA